MSGIIGSYFNTRGSGVVAKLGTDGQVFTSTGAGLSQGFEAAAGGGKVLQVISYVDDTARATTAGTWVTASNTLGGDITCAATSSKVLIMVNTAMNITANDGAATVFRDATNLGHSSYGFDYTHIVSQLRMVTIIYLDSPSSTSALTYQVKFGNISGGSTMTLNNNVDIGSLVLIEIGA